MEAHYTYSQHRHVEGTIHLDELTAKAYRNAKSDEERYDIVADVVTEEVHGSPGTGVLTRNIDVSVIAEEKVR